jgi:hypothetical protein
MTKYSRLVAVSAFILLLQACAAMDPMTTDALPQLKPGEGIAGIAFDSVWELRSVQFEGDFPGAPKLRVADVPVGESAFLFVVPAGQYCLVSYSLAGKDTGLWSKQDDRCFDVEAGKLSYSGTFVPDFNPLDIIINTRKPSGRMTREDRPRAFLNALSLNYPHIAAAAFPTGSDRSVADLAPPGVAPSGSVCTLLTQDEAGGLLAKPVRPGSEFNMQTIDACNFMHSDDESVHVLLYTGDDHSSQFAGIGFEASATGATEWAPVPSLGEKAAFGCKKDHCELDVLWQGRVLALVVDGNERKDIADALTAVTRQVLARWQANPAIGMGGKPAPVVMKIPPR